MVRDGGALRVSTLSSLLYADQLMVEASANTALSRARVQAVRYDTSGGLNPYFAKRAP